MATGFGLTDAGGCPAPFVSEVLYPHTGGWLPSRNCEPNILSNSTDASLCCLPCPLHDYIYPSNFDTLANGAAWVHVVSFILCSFLLISMIIFPKESRRAYLNIVLLVGVLLFSLGFVIPLARKPPKCFDKITQTSQGDNFTCAISGALAAFGALFLVFWILIRALFMHLQVCWNITPATKSYIAANIAAFSITIALTTAELAHDGVSARFGHYCHVNTGSVKTYFGWMLAFARLSFLLQTATAVYCLKVYLAYATAGGHNTLSTSRSESLAASSKTRNARITARRVKKVAVLQWRSFSIVTLAIFISTFVCVVFIISARSFSARATAGGGNKLLTWVVCLVSSQEVENCLPYIRPLIIGAEIIHTTLYLEAFVGILAFILLCRVDIFKAYWSHLRTPFWKRPKRNDSTSTGHLSFVLGSRKDVDEKGLDRRTSGIKVVTGEMEGFQYPQYPPKGIVRGEEVEPLQRKSLTPLGA